MPVKFGSSPARARAVQPFGSRPSHSASGVATWDLDELALGETFCLAVSRSLRNGEISDHQHDHPGVDEQFGDLGDAPDVSTRSASVKPRSRVRPCRILSPSSSILWRPSA